MFKKILVVCVGNICRSPTAELLLRNAPRDSSLEAVGDALSAAGRSLRHTIGDSGMAGDCQTTR